MSKSVDLHDGVGTLASVPGLGIVHAVSTSAPTASASGFANGAIWQHVGGAADSNIFINEGTVASATWVASPT